MVVAGRTEAVASRAACPSWGAFEGLVEAFPVARFNREIGISFDIKELLKEGVIYKGLLVNELLRKAFY